MAGDEGPTYEPVNTLKPVCDEVWIIDGPVIRFGMPWPKMPFPTRMTVIRIGGSLFLHSPTELTPALAATIRGLAEPRWIVGPNRIHYWWVPDWHRAFPDAEVHLAPGIKEQAAGRIDFAHRTLAPGQACPWDEALETLLVTGSYMTEAVFFDRRSRTLVLTDLIENFEPRKLGSWWMRWLTRLGGVQDPDGQMPRDMRLTFRGDREALRRAVETMIAWNPERVLLAHGRWYPTDGAAELRRAFRWLLD